MGLEVGRGAEKEKEEKEKEEEKIPLCESIGHRPHRGRCPKRKERKKERERMKRNGLIILWSLAEKTQIVHR